VVDFDGRGVGPDAELLFQCLDAAVVGTKRLAPVAAPSQRFHQQAVRRFVDGVDAEQVAGVLNDVFVPQVVAR